VNGGSAIGDSPTFIVNESAAAPPDLYEVETEGHWAYGIVDNSCTSGVENWVGVAFFKDWDGAAPRPTSALVTGCAKVVATGPNGGFYSVSGSASVLELGGAANDWTAAEAGVVGQITPTRIGIGAPVNATDQLEIGGTLNVSNEQIGVEVNPTYAGGPDYGFAYGPTVAPGVHVANVTAYYVGSAHDGADASIDTYYGYYCTGMEGATTSYCLYSDSTGPSHLEGPLEVAGGIDTGRGAGINTDLAGQLELQASSGQYVATQAFTTYKNPPVCVATNTSGQRSLQVTATAAGLTVTGAAADLVNYICVGQQ